MRAFEVAVLCYLRVVRKPMVYLLRIFLLLRVVGESDSGDEQETGKFSGRPNPAFAIHLQFSPLDLEDCA